MMDFSWSVRGDIQSRVYRRVKTQYRNMAGWFIAVWKRHSSLQVLKACPVARTRTQLHASMLCTICRFSSSKLGLQCFRLLPPDFFSVPVVSALAFAARIASRSSGLASSISCDALLTRLGSSLPTRGTDEAMNSWKGPATKRPVSSNQDAKEWETSRELAGFLVSWTVTLRL